MPLVDAHRGDVYRLINVARRYDWGSATAIAEFLGAQPDGQPIAELWLGAHQSAPSLAVPIDPTVAWDHTAALNASLGTAPAPATAIRLDDLIASDPVRTLGTACFDAFGPRLPYLFKVLAAERPLSLQVHPFPHSARAGFNRENAAGIALTDPARSFVDDQHKPEMIFALDVFVGLAGFRPLARARQLLAGLAGGTVGKARDALTARGTTSPQGAFHALLEARGLPGLRDDLTVTARSIAARAEASPAPNADVMALWLHEHYPDDPGFIASLLLNRFELVADQAVFLGSGQIHAYMHGLGLEIMANSNNVLRAGWTSKHVNVPALLECVSYVPAPPERPARAFAPDGALTLSPPVSEFALTVAQAHPVSPVALPASGPRIVLCLSESVDVVRPAAPPVGLRRGESLFVTDGAGAVAITGSGRVAVASVP